MRVGVNAIATAPRAAWAFIPGTASLVLRCLGERDAERPCWTGAAIAPGRKITVPGLLFAKLDDDEVDRLVRRFGGTT